MARASLERAGRPSEDAFEESGKRRRTSQERYITMWAQAVETVVSPLPKVRSIRSTPEKENAGPPDFLESEMARRGAASPSRAKPREVASPVTAAPRDKTQAQPKKRPNAPAPTEPLNEYEREREARIARNKLMLHQLRVASNADALVACAEGASKKTKRASSREGEARESKKRGKNTSASAVPPRAPSTRVTRNRGKALDEDPAFARLAAENPAEYGFLVADAKDASSRKKETRLLADAEYTRSCEAWCDAAGLAKGPKMDGRFRGWVAERACDALGIARTAEAHWSTNAGAETRPSGKESAKAFALRMMRVNPNAFFYRHNLPGEAARHGEWSQQEIDRFVAVATEHGAGDKWGLFASHIPGRVGYACSSLYRQHCIPNGLLMDDNFRVDERGEAVWVGRKRAP